MATDKKRPRKQPPNQVWLDAIMSTTRSVDPIAVGSNGMAPPPHKQMRLMPAAGKGDERAKWQAVTAPPQAHIASLPPVHSGTPTAPTTRSSRTPSPALVSTTTAASESLLPDPHPYVDQLLVDDAALIAALTTSLKELVTEQDCSFIARGFCHLCANNGHEKKLVPVVNFCPEFAPTHSLCREHLRSMHRVRLVDIFAGKNQPTVSKRALRCAVCSLSCPCSACQLRRKTEIYKYKQWLGGQRSNGDVEFSMGPRTRSRQQTPPPPLPLPPTSAPPVMRQGYPDQTDGSRGRPYPSRDVNMGDRPYAPADAKERVSNRPLYYGGEEKSVSDGGDGLYPLEASLGGLLPSALRAEAKVAARGSGRFPKRAAKESIPYALDPYVPPPHGHAYQGSSTLGGNAPTLVSPSAASVLNCPDSEKSLVDLLSSLNQQVTPAVRYFADADEPRFRDMMEDVPQTYMSESYVQAQRSGGVSVQGYDGEEEMRLRRQKRKRENARASSKISEDGRFNSMESVAQDGGATYRRQAPTPLATAERKPKHTIGPSPASRQSPSPSPPSRGRSSAKIKATPTEPKGSASRKRDPPTPTAVTRKDKRKNETTSSGSTDRKSPRGTAHHTHGPKASSEVRKQKADKQHSAEEAEEEEEEGDDDDSELDTNLDYCEVCLAAGDLVCCDVCPRSFHLKCLKLTEDDLPEGDWQCAECRKPSYFESFSAAVASKTTVPSKCMQIIQCLKSHPFAKPFLLPVENVPHYTNIVKQPMDLSTIEKKLDEHKYMVNGKGTMQGAHGVPKILHLGAFAEDVRLVWSNCKLFNDDGSGITRAADQLSDGFEKLYRDVVKYAQQSSAAPSTTAEHRDEKKPLTVAQPIDRDVAAITQSVQQNEEKNMTETKSTASSKKHTGEPTNQPANDAVTKDSATGSSASQIDATPRVPEGSNRPSGSVPTAPLIVNDASALAAMDASNLVTGTSVEKEKVLEADAGTVVQSTSPSPVTTATSTPSPAQSTTTTFVKAPPLTAALVEKSGVVSTEDTADGAKSTDLSALSSGGSGTTATA